MKITLSVGFVVGVVVDVGVLVRGGSEVMKRVGVGVCVGVFVGGGSVESVGGGHNRRAREAIIFHFAFGKFARAVPSVRERRRVNRFVGERGANPKILRRE